jgi:hypothetical protein
MVELLLAMAVVFLLGAILFVAAAPIREKNRHATCVRNLHQLGQALFMYMNDYSGGGCEGFYGLPPSLDRLYPRHISDLSVLRCPNDDGGGVVSYGYHLWKGRDPYYLAPLRRWSAAPDWCRMFNGLDEDFPLVWDDYHNTLSGLESGFRRWIVLFKGGKVESLITDVRANSVDLRPQESFLRLSGPQDNGSQNTRVH